MRGLKSRLSSSQSTNTAQQFSRKGSHLSTTDETSEKSHSETITSDNNDDNNTSINESEVEIDEKPVILEQRDQFLTTYSDSDDSGILENDVPNSPETGSEKILKLRSIKNQTHTDVHKKEKFIEKDENEEKKQVLIAEKC